MTIQSEEATQEVSSAVGEDEQTVLKARYMMIAEAAYFRAEKRGFAPGNEVADWLDAEAEINNALGRLPAQAPDIRQSIRDLTADEVTNLATKVRLLALRTLASGRLDVAAVKEVVREAIRGAEEGVSPLGERGRDVLPDILAGLERALSDVVNASALAIREAHGNAAQFSKDELEKVIEEVHALKSLLGDVLNESLASAGGAARAILQIQADHARTNAVHFAAQIDQVLVTLGDKVLPPVRLGARAGKQALKECGDTLKNAKAAALRSIAERLERENPDDKP